MYLTRYYVEKQLNDEYILVFNTLSGSLDIFEKEKYHMIKDAVDDVDIDLQENLKSRGYFFDSPDDEKKAMKALEIKKQVPSLFIIAPTYACNLNCSYCFEKNNSVKELTMPPEMLESALKMIKTLKGMHDKETTIQIYGGEPLLPNVRQHIARIFEFADTENCKITIISNGVYAGEAIPILGKYTEMIKYIQITVDGDKETHDKRRVKYDGSGSFEEIIASVEQLLASKIHVVLRVNVDAFNVDQISQLIKLIEEKGWDSQPNFNCEIAPVQDNNNHQLSGILSEKDFIELAMKAGLLEYEKTQYLRITAFRALAPIIRTVEKILHGKDFPEKDLKYVPGLNYCESTGLTAFLFGADGYIYCCNEAIGNPDLAIGTFYPKYELFTDSPWRIRNASDMEQCVQCNLMPLCKGGCPLQSIQSYGNVANPNCEGQREAVEAYFELIREPLLEMIQNKKAG